MTKSYMGKFTRHVVKIRSLRDIRVLLFTLMLSPPSMLVAYQRWYQQLSSPTPHPCTIVLGRLHCLRYYPRRTSVVTTADAHSYCSLDGMGSALAVRRYHVCNTNRYSMGLQT